MSGVKGSVCLFCSAVEDLPQAARTLAGEFGAQCAARGLRLVYGGSGRGLMGIAARRKEKDLDRAQKDAMLEVGNLIGRSVDGARIARPEAFTEHAAGTARDARCRNGHF